MQVAVDAFLKYVLPYVTIPLLFTVGTAVAVMLVRLLMARIGRNEQDVILGVVSGLYPVVAAIAKATDTPIDDAIALLIKKVEEEMGRNLKPKEAVRVRNIALAKHVDPDEPDLSHNVPLAVALNTPPKKS